MRVASEPASAVPPAGLKRQAARFATVGIACVLLNVGLFAVLVDWLGLGVLAVTVLSFILGNLVSFALNRSWTFVAAGGPLLPQIAKFSTVQVSSLALNLTLMWWLVTILGIRAVIASLVVSASFAVGNFLAQRSWVFRKASKP